MLYEDLKSYPQFRLAINIETYILINISNKLNIMSKQKWLEEQREQFDLCLKSGSYEDIMEAYEIILEVEHQGFKDEVVSLQNAWDEYVQVNHPSLWKIHTSDY